MDPAKGGCLRQLWLKAGVGLEFMSGYRGVKFAKGFTDKELRILELLKK